MDKHNDMRAMVRQMTFSEEQPSFYLLNVGETHYPYALPDEPPDQWPRISGVHGVFKHLDDEVVGGKLLVARKRNSSTTKKLEALRQRQIEAVKYLDRRGRGTIRHGPEEHLHHDHGRPRGIVRRRRLFRPRAHSARESLGGAVRRGKAAMMRTARTAVGACVLLIACILLVAPLRRKSDGRCWPTSARAPDLHFSVRSSASWPDLCSASFRCCSGRSAWLGASCAAGRVSGNARVKKVIFLGLDGLDPQLTERFMAEGKLPNLARLKEQGSYSRLRTTFPVALAGGLVHVRHRRESGQAQHLRLPEPEHEELCSGTGRGQGAQADADSETRAACAFRSRARTWNCAAKASRSGRFSGEQQIGSTIIRVPDHVSAGKIQRPPAFGHVDARSARHPGQLFAFHARASSRPRYESGSRYPLKRSGTALKASLEGPEDCAARRRRRAADSVPHSASDGRTTPSSRFRTDRYKLEPGEYTPWVKLKFNAALGHQGQRHRAVSW